MRTRARAAGLGRRVHEREERGDVGALDAGALGHAHERVEVLVERPHFEPEPPLPTLVSGDLALTSTAPKRGAGARAQVARRQPDGTWLRILDQPEFTHPTPERYLVHVLKMYASRAAEEER